MDEGAAPLSEVVFEVRYPWGSSYVEQMRQALEALGMVTAENPFVGDHDIDGLVFAETEAGLQAGLALAETAIAKYEALLPENGDDDEDGDAYSSWLWGAYEQLGTVGVHYIEQDWKHCSWEDDHSFEHVGLERELLTDAVDGEHVLVFRLSRRQS